MIGQRGNILPGFTFQREAKLVVKQGGCVSAKYAGVGFALTDTDFNPVAVSLNIGRFDNIRYSRTRSAHAIPFLLVPATGDNAREYGALSQLKSVSNLNTVNKRLAPFSLQNRRFCVHISCQPHQFRGVATQSRGLSNSLEPAASFLNRRHFQDTRPAVLSPVTVSDGQGITASMRLIGVNSGSGRARSIGPIMNPANRRNSVLHTPQAPSGFPLTRNVQAGSFIKNQNQKRNMT